MNEYLQNKRNKEGGRELRNEGQMTRNRKKVWIFFDVFTVANTLMFTMGDSIMKC